MTGKDYITKTTGHKLLNLHTTSLWSKSKSTSISTVHVCQPLITFHQSRTVLQVVSEWPQQSLSRRNQCPAMLFHRLLWYWKLRKRKDRENETEAIPGKGKAPSLPLLLLPPLFPVRFHIWHHALPASPSPSKSPHALSNDKHHFRVSAIKHHFVLRNNLILTRKYWSSTVLA